MNAADALHSLRYARHQRWVFTNSLAADALRAFEAMEAAFCAEASLRGSCYYRGKEFRISFPSDATEIEIENISAGLYCAVL